MLMPLVLATGVAGWFFDICCPPTKKPVAPQFWPPSQSAFRQEMQRVFPYLDNVCSFWRF